LKTLIFHEKRPKSVARNVFSACIEEIRFDGGLENGDCVNRGKTSYLTCRNRDFPPSFGQGLRMAAED
jgi:hypothetical protein